MPARRYQYLSGLLLEFPCITESDSQRECSITLVFDGALPLRNLHIDRVSRAGRAAEHP